LKVKKKEGRSLIGGPSIIKKEKEKKKKRKCPSDTRSTNLQWPEKGKTNSVWGGKGKKGG